MSLLHPPKDWSTGSLTFIPLTLIPKGEADPATQSRPETEKAGSGDRLRCYNARGAAIFSIGISWGGFNGRQRESDLAASTRPGLLGAHASPVLADGGRIPT